MAEETSIANFLNEHILALRADVMSLGASLSAKVDAATKEWREDIVEVRKQLSQLVSDSAHYARRVTDAEDKVKELEERVTKLEDLEKERAGMWKATKWMWGILAVIGSAILAALGSLLMAGKLGALWAAIVAAF